VSSYTVKSREIAFSLPMADQGHNPVMPTGDEAKKAHVGSGPDPEEVISQRSGEVLIKHTVLKADHFPSEKRGREREWGVEGSVGARCKCSHLCTACDNPRQ
jgi:hypothetical protein